MSAPGKGKIVLLVLGVVIAAIAVVAVVKRDFVADLILKGGDTSLTGESAQSSRQARLALDFLVALRAADLKTMMQLTTSEQAARIEREETNPTPDYREMKTMMLSDLPADPAELRGRIKSVQTHKNRGVVTFETKANSWMLILEDVNGTWKVASF